MSQQFQEDNFQKMDSDQSSALHQYSHDHQIQKPLQNKQLLGRNFQGTQIKQQINKPLIKRNLIEQIAGIIFPIFLVVIAVYILYLAFYDSFVYYRSVFGHSDIFLNESNAKQYFAQNPIRAGQIHYARIPVEYWQHRIQMIKSMGLNTLSVYVFWNFHQIQKGKFDFQTKNKNLTYFIELSKIYGMDILLRPGPYVCAQWDFGGLPARLLAVQDLQIRSSNSLFIQQTKLYFQQLSKVIKNHIKNKDNPSGSIIMIQVQNQPSYFTKQKLYLDKLKQLWQDLQIACPLYFDDTFKSYVNNTATESTTSNLYWQKAILGMNLPKYEKDLFKQFENQSNFVFAGQVYSGWFNAWGNQNTSSSKDINQHLKTYHQGFRSQFQSLIQDNISFSMYMVHGGTNFELNAGYNILTSYDYGAPINEQGLPTQNFHTFRQIISNNTQLTLSPIPQSIQSMQLVLGSTKKISSLFDNIPQPVLSKTQDKNPLPFQSQQLKMFNQGLVLYQTILKGPFNYTFQIQIHDIAFIYVDSNFLTVFQRPLTIEKTKFENLNINCEKKQCKLQILVEAMGHVNFGLTMKNDKKGILLFEMATNGKKTKDIKFDWKYYTFNLIGQPQWKYTQKCNQSPCLYFTEFNLNENKDTYISILGLSKGYIWVNGHNLGRYWNIGPQKKLYCPGVWLIKGKNKILILEMFQPNLNVVLKGEKSLN